MGTKELVLRKINQMSEEDLSKVLAFISLLEREDKNETAFLSESSLKKDWLRPEEDEAWKDL